MEIEFDELFSFLRSRYPFPFRYGIDRGFRQHRTATNDLSEFHFPVGRNHGLHPDGSADLHFLGQLWILWGYLTHYLPCSWWLFLSMRNGWAEGDHSQGKRY